MIEVPGYRVGHPSPLIYHLGVAATTYQAAIATANRTENLNALWQPSLLDEVKGVENLDILELSRSSLERLQGFISGLEKWQKHPYQRTMQKPAVIWSNGSSRLLDYGSCEEATNPNGSPVLVIPSLINQAYILDLHKERSLLRYMASKGLRPILLDWGYPTDTERDFDLDDYVIQRFLPALEVCRALSNKPIGILGYCMGGTLAAGVTSIYGDGIGAFSTIGSPWDFGASKGVPAALRKLASEQDAPKFLENMGNAFGMIPVDFFQQLFAFINPIQAAVKFRKFGEMDQSSAQAEHFVAIEDWLADGVPLVSQTARDLLIGWNLNNDTAGGRWHLTGEQVDLENIKQPTLNICGIKDSITQLGVATAIGADIPNSKILTPDAGHVGMIVGTNSRNKVWEPVSDFFTETLK